MVVPYHDSGMDPTATPRRTFRHDKIGGYFLVQASLGADNERPGRHLGEFRGVYLQLADLLPT